MSKLFPHVTQHLKNERLEAENFTINYLQMAFRNFQEKSWKFTNFRSRWRKTITELEF